MVVNGRLPRGKNYCNIIKLKGSYEDDRIQVSIKASIPTPLPDKPLFRVEPKNNQNAAGIRHGETKKLDRALLHPKYALQ